MAAEIQINRARLADAQAIADFVNRAHEEEVVGRLDVAQRFGQVSFMLAMDQDQLIGLMGWQVENLVIRIADFLIAPGIDSVSVGEKLVAEVEDAGEQLQAEAAMLFLPLNPSSELTTYWEHLGYEYRAVADVSRAWREAVKEWDKNATEVMVKQLRQDLVRRPI